MKSILTFIFYFSTIHCFSQSKFQKLIVAEYRKDSPQVGNYTYLVSYNFKKGVFMSKDTILGAEVFKEGVKGSYVRYDIGKNFIYKNRFVVAANGAVIDVKTKKLVREQPDRFIEALGDTLIFRRNNIYTDKGYLALNLKTGDYAFIAENSWYKPKKGRPSPDGKNYLTIYQSTIPYKVYLTYSNDVTIVAVPNAGHGPYTIDTQLPTIETVWLNNHTFLYAIHEPKKDSAKRISYKVTLRTYNINNRADRVFFTLDSVPKGHFNGRFTKNGIGQLIYTATSGKSYIVDTIRKTLGDYPFVQLGYNFSTRGTKEGTIVRYNNIEIGTIWSTFPLVDHGVIAVMYNDVGSNLGYPKGLKIWTQQTEKWLTIDLPWVSKIIGWLTEE